MSTMTATEPLYLTRLRLNLAHPRIQRRSATLRPCTRW